MAGKPPLSKLVRTFGWVSLLNDLASEMIYPLLPAFLTGVLGAQTIFLGVIEGLAESVASIMKVASGWLADRLPRRKPLVIAGYVVASVVRPLVAVAQAPWHVLTIRAADRLGKGVRSAPRDALIASVTQPRERGRAFGFQRAMDHTGALLGPLVAAALLGFGLSLRTVFALALIPGLATVAPLVLGVREDVAARAVVKSEPVARLPLPAGLKRYLIVLAIFTLGNSSDAFLLLHAQKLGISLTVVPLLWTFHHALKALLGTHGGTLSDRFGRRTTIALGWLVYALAYGGFALASTPLHVWIAFAVYALHFSLCEGAERALVADLCPAAVQGKAFGLFHAVTGATLLPASVLMGWLWQAFGASVGFAAGAAAAGIATLALIAVRPPRAVHGVERR